MKATRKTAQTDATKKAAQLWKKIGAGMERANQHATHRNRVLADIIKWSKPAADQLTAEVNAAIESNNRTYSPQKNLAVHVHNHALRLKDTGDVVDAIELGLMLSQANAGIIWRGSWLIGLQPNHVKIIRAIGNDADAKSVQFAAWGKHESRSFKATLSTLNAALKAQGCEYVLSKPKGGDSIIVKAR